MRAAWHCLWQRFPGQSDPRPAPAPTSPLGRAAGALYNLSLAGERPGAACWEAPSSLFEDGAPPASLDSSEGLGRAHAPRSAA